jgi:hypothetical protein
VRGADGKAVDRAEAWAKALTAEGLDAVRAAVAAVDAELAAVPEVWRERLRDEYGKRVKQLKAPKRRADAEWQLRAEKAEAWKAELAAAKAKAERIELEQAARAAEVSRAQRAEESKRAHKETLRRKHEAEQLRVRLELNEMKRLAIDREREKVAASREVEEKQRRRARREKFGLS